MKTLRTPFFLQQIEDYGIDDDFLQAPDTTNKYALTATNSGTAAITANALGGIVALNPSTGGGSANDELYLASAQSIFKPIGGQPIYAEALVQYTEANTNDANVVFGIASAVATGLLVTSSAGMRASGTCAVIYKVGGGTVWRCPWTWWTT